MFRKHLIYTLVCQLEKNIFKTSDFLEALQLAQIKLPMCLKFPKSSNLIKTSFSVGKIEHTFKNLDMIALQKYSWILSQKFLLLSSDSPHQKISFALCSAQHREETWLALLVLLLPRTPQKEERTRQKTPTKQNLKTLTNYDTLISSLDHTVEKSRLPSDPLSHFCPTALKAQKPTVPLLRHRGLGDAQHPPLKWEEVHSHTTVTHPGLYREAFLQVSFLLLIIFTLSSSQKEWTLLA